jgi:hypothetical protein
MKFFVDQTLGALAKWLRLCGFDATLVTLRPPAYAALPPPASQVWILTRQQALARRGRPDLLLLGGATTSDQLAEVLARLHLTIVEDETLSRCSRCNLPLAPTPREAVVGRVPDYVYAKHHHFLECPGCRRLYWGGSHLKGIRRQLNRLPVAGPPNEFSASPIFRGD